MNPWRDRSRGRTLVAWLALTFAPLANAAGIEYLLTSLGAGKWQADYTLVNPDSSLSFDEITVYFALPAVQTIESFAVPAGWDSFIAQADPALPADGFVDSRRAAGLVPPGTRTSGFSAVFEVPIGFIPGSQSFDLVNSNGPSGFEVVASGVTSAVPEPRVAALTIAGLAFVGMAARRRSSRGCRSIGEGSGADDRGAT